MAHPRVTESVQLFPWATWGAEQVGAASAGSAAAKTVMVRRVRNGLPPVSFYSIASESFYTNSLSRRPVLVVIYIVGISLGVKNERVPRRVIVSDHSCAAGGASCAYTNTGECAPGSSRPER